MSMLAGSPSAADPFDLLVIGGGPGGYAAALFAAAAGATVALVERAQLGGTCLHRGCIPAKHLLEVASARRAASDARTLGHDVTLGGLDWTRARARQDQIVSTLWKGLTGLVAGRNVTVYAGTGALRRGRQVEVTTADGSRTTLCAGAVVLATGSTPKELPILPVDGLAVLTSDHVPQIDALPASLAIIGGGAIGVEYASAFVDLGVEVVLVEGRERLLPEADADVGAAIAKSLARRGVSVKLRTTAQDAAIRSQGVTLHLSDDELVNVSQVVVAVGRNPVVPDLGDTAVRLLPGGHVDVDGHMRTAESGVYAVGDLVASPPLAHVAFAEARVAVTDALLGSADPIDAMRVPWAIYSHPEVGFVGMTESQARNAGYDVAVLRHSHRGNGRAQILGETDGFIKLVAARGQDGGFDTLLGAHLVGARATEQLGGFVAAVSQPVASTPILPHPSFSEVLGEGLLHLGGTPLHS